MRTDLSCVAVVMMSAALFACGGGSGPTGAPAGNNDTGDDGGASTPIEAGEPEAEAAPPVDHGAPSTTYPAFTPAFGQLQNNGGYIMKNPVIVPVTWDSDPSQAKFDAFADQLGPSNYWNQTSSEYGIGPAVSGTTNHVHISTAAPATIQDSDLQTMVATNAAASADGGTGTAGGWPAATTDTIYAFFLPPGTSLLIASGYGSSGNTPTDACGQGVGGYHDQVSWGSTLTAYAVVPSCNFGGTPTIADQSTESMSHEINEAASDPQPEANTPGLVGFTNDGFAWDYFQEFQSEDGDACEFFYDGPDSSFYEDQETSPAFDYWVQRIWSNKSGAAGHNPCVPAPADPYFNVTPLGLEKVNVSIPGELTGSSSATQEPTKGFKVLAGQSGKFQVGFYSDAATSGPWTISAASGNPLTAGQGGLDSYNKSAITLSIDKTTGVNGEKAWVTVNVTTTGSSFKGELVTITSTLGKNSHYLPVWIAGQ